MYTLERQGGTLLLTEIENANTHARIKKISKELYIDLSTNKIKKFNKKAKVRTDNIKALYKTMRDLRALINTNCEHPESVLWLTFTYKENMTDTKRLKNDYSKFWKRFCYYSNKNNLEKPEYIYVIEPQARGAWHIHALFIYKHKRPFIENDEIARIWGHGFTKTKALKNADNVAGYLTSYLCDLDLAEIDKKEEKKKSIVKGGRMLLYPKGIRIYRTSKNIRRPTKYKIPKFLAVEIRKTREMIGETITEYRDEQSGYNTCIVKQYYNNRKARNEKRKNHKRT